MAATEPLTPDQILARTAAFFGRPVLKLTAPGGRSRASYRAYFSDGTVIVSQRPDQDRNAIEARLLEALSPLTTHVPRLLGRDGSLVFQEDAGAERLNHKIHTLPPADRPALAAQAIDALLDLHRAGQTAGLAAALSIRGLRAIPGDDLLAGVAKFGAQLHQPPQGFDPARLHPWFRLPPARFTKWDCRAGNAALDALGHLRWFDFEDARLGHGPEDFAWLMADETWPIAMDQMHDLIAARLTTDETDDPATYLAYLCEYTVLQAIRRIRLIFAEARRKGWLDRVTILKYDRLGTNPHMGERLAENASRLARRAPATAPLSPLLDHAAEVFRKVRMPQPQGSVSEN